MNKIGIVIGHNPIAQGAQGFTGAYEWSYHTNMIYKHLLPLRKELGKPDNLVVDWREGQEDDLKFESQLIAERMAAKNCKFVLELHFNAFNSVSVFHRCQYLTTGEMIMADSVGNNFLKVMKDRFISSRVAFTRQLLTPNGRGRINLDAFESQGIPAIILEPFFGDTENFLSNVLLKKPEKYAGILSDLLNYLEYYVWDRN